MGALPHHDRSEVSRRYGVRLSGLSVLVTAGGQGIGRACVEAAMREGAHVFATDHHIAPLAELRSDAVHIAEVDGTDGDAVAAHAAAFGPFDAVIHCVGYVHQGTVLDCPPEQWSRSFNLNVNSYFAVLRSVLPGMLATGGGSIVAIASVASSIKGLSSRAAYGASKAAMIGLTKSVAADFVDQGIRANAVCPGTIETPSLSDRIRALGEQVGGADIARARFTERQPMSRLGTPEEVAALCIYLASPESRFMTGQALSIDGGITI